MTARHINTTALSSVQQEGCRLNQDYHRIFVLFEFGCQKEYPTLNLTNQSQTDSLMEDQDHILYNLPTFFLENQFSQMGSNVVKLCYN